MVIELQCPWCETEFGVDEAALDEPCCPACSTTLLVADDAGEAELVAAA